MSASMVVFFSFLRWHLSSVSAPRSLSNWTWDFPLTGCSHSLLFFFGSLLLLEFVDIWGHPQPAETTHTFSLKKWFTENSKWKRKNTHTGISTEGPYNYGRIKITARFHPYLATFSLLQLLWSKISCLLALISVTEFLIFFKIFNNFFFTNAFNKRKLSISSTGGTPALQPANPTVCQWPRESITNNLCPSIGCEHFQSCLGICWGECRLGKGSQYHTSLLQHSASGFLLCET